MHQSSKNQIKPHRWHANICLCRMYAENSLFCFVPFIRAIRSIITHIQCHRCAYSDNKEKSIGVRWGYKNKTVCQDGSVVNSLWTENQYRSSKSGVQKKDRNFKLKTIHIEIAIECVVRGWYNLVFFNFVQSHQFWSRALCSPLHSVSWHVNSILVE